jgi:protein involved in plasmid replication-relaxation
MSDVNSPEIRKRRQPRGVRRRGVTAHLTRRDEVLLRALARFRIARTRDLVAYAFPGVRADTAAARLRHLFDAQFLEVRGAGLFEENLYALGPEGRTCLTDLGIPFGRVPRGNLEHHLAIVRTWIAVARAVQAVPGLQLVSARADWELREEAGACPPVLVPDLLVRLRRNEDSEALLAIEVDLGTEPLGVLRRKFQVYETVGWETVSRSGLAVALVTVAVGKSRVAGVRQALKDVWSGPWLTWAAEDGPALALQALLDFEKTPLVNPHSDKGSLISVSSSPASALSTEREGL